jgi:hypothetical protein
LPLQMSWVIKHYQTFENPNIWNFIEQTGDIA